MEHGASATDKRSSVVPVSVAIVAIVTGTVLRIIDFVRDRPLWLDEAMLSLNIGARSFGQLARPLDYDQSAPLLYLWIERAAVSLGGVNERSLRALPFVAGLALAPAVWFLARRLAGTATAAIATVLVALSVTLVSFSVEAKQYGADPAATLLAVWLAIRVTDAPNDGRRWSGLIGGGVACLLLSHPAAFVLGGVVAALAVDERVRRTPSAPRRLAVTSAIWAVTFAALYFTLYRATADSAYMQRFWEGTYLDPRADDFALRLRMFASAAFAAPTLAASAIRYPAVLALTGMVGVWTLWRRGRFAAVVVGSPVVLAAIASGIARYPVMDRLYLFAAPLTLIAYASALAFALEKVRGRTRPIALAGACAVLALTTLSTHARRVAAPVFFGVGEQIVADVDRMSRGEPVYVAARSFPLWVYYTTDWRAPDRDRLRWAASISGAGGPAHNNAPPRGRLPATESAALMRSYRGRVEIVGLPTGRQYLTSTRTLDPGLSVAEYALPLEPDSGWAGIEVRRLAAVAQPRAWVFGSHMFALDGAEPSLVAELKRTGVRLVMERRQGSTVAYQVEFPAQP
jgi:hypothetical protein